MKKIIMVITTILLPLFLTNCTSNEYAFADNELNSQVKDIIIKSDFWYSFYTGNYYFPTDEIEISENGHTFKSFKVEYSRIPTDIELKFDNISQYYSTDTYYADMPFKSISEIKDKVESVYTYEWAKKSLYSIYDSDYLEYDNMLLRAFERDTIYGSIDYDMLKITSVSDNEICVKVSIYYTANDEPELRTYTLKLYNGTWKIDNII